MTDGELADAVGDVEELVYRLWLDLGEARRETRCGDRVGRRRICDLAVAAQGAVAGLSRIGDMIGGDDE